jgi:predicted PP-loop superfamily ATPase
VFQPISFISLGHRYTLTKDSVRSGINLPTITNEYKIDERRVIMIGQSKSMVKYGIPIGKIKVSRG